ncbi:zinc-dependent alcohol dehydrogenase [Roseibium aestuarii]|uniref:Zinc-binding alcohol dehydrogenase n=1 Tax=Roseibium aestuarii TaxID=2600299 RepID=A0ABW4JR46_9HYPH|nr:zinc-binding alcohol dehydrogenase [Roseibium aestuarii]
MDERVSADRQARGAESRARALWVTGPAACALREEPLARPGPQEVLVESLFGAISRGTERLVFDGAVPPGEHERMRGPHMGGSFPFPVKYGYAVCGRVTGGAPDLLGKTVFCLHPHQDRFVVSRDAVTVLPEGVPAERAPLAANMETALNILWDSEILAGDRVAVFGAGVVGGLVALLAAQIPGVELWLVDPLESRQSLAISLGARFVSPQALGGEAPFDVIVNASASGEALAQGLAVAGPGARLVEASWYGDRQVSLPLGGAFHAGRLALVSSQVGQIPVRQSPRWTYRRRLTKALELLRDDRVETLFTGMTAFSALGPSYETILRDPATLCHRIRYDQ